MTKCEEPDPFTRACELVGRFLYYFSRVELQLDDAITKLFKLDANTAPIVTANIDFFKKLNIVQTAVNHQQRAKPGGLLSVDTDETFKGIASVNNYRQVVAHSAFEPAPTGGVKFKRTIAKGTLQHEDPHWTETDFETRFSSLQRLETDLRGIVGEIEPDRVDWPIASRFLGLPAHLIPFSGDEWLGSPRVLLEPSQKK